MNTVPLRVERIPLKTEACFSIKDVDYVAYVHYVYYSYSNQPEEPDFEIKNIALTIDGYFDSPLIETEDELFYTLVEKDEIIEAVYESIKNYEIEQECRSEMYQ